MAAGRAAAGPALPRHARRPPPLAPSPAGGAAVPCRPRRRPRHAGDRRQRGAGAEVQLLADGREIGRARADARGEWVVLPGDPLPPGPKELSLLARSPGGEPDRAPARRCCWWYRSRRWPRGRRLRAPRRPAPWPCCCRRPPPPAPRRGRCRRPAEARPGRQRLGLDVVDYDEAGAMRFAGSAPPGATVRVYVGREHAGDAVADPAGRWALSPATQPAYGRHTLRVDQLAAAGSVAARIELPFQRDRVHGGGAGRWPAGGAARHQPLAHRPPGLWPRHPLHRDLPGEPGADPRPEPDLSRAGCSACPTARPRQRPAGPDRGPSPGRSGPWRRSGWSRSGPAPCRPPLRAGCGGPAAAAAASPVAGSAAGRHHLEGRRRGRPPARRSRGCGRRWPRGARHPPPPRPRSAVRARQNAGQGAARPASAAGHRPG